MAVVEATVVVGTYGDLGRWGPLAQRAVASAVVAGAAHVVHRHGDTLHGARNEGAATAETEWLCFLDADDELEPGYFEAMAEGDTDLRAPLVRYVTDGRYQRAQARIPAGTDDMAEGNRLVVGTLVRREMFDAVGGFRDWPLYEDWDLWQRCWLAGATIGFTRAVYRAHVRRDSRNRAPSRPEKLAAHHAIRRANMPWLYPDEEGR